MLRRPCNMVVCESSHEVVAVIVVRLHAELNALVVTSRLGGFDKIFGEELALLVEIVSSALGCLVTRPQVCGAIYTHHIDEHLQWSFPLLHQL